MEILEKLKAEKKSLLTENKIKPLNVMKKAMLKDLTRRIAIREKNILAIKEGRQMLPSTK